MSRISVHLLCTFIIAIFLIMLGQFLFAPASNLSAASVTLAASSRSSSATHLAALFEEQPASTIQHTFRRPPQFIPLQDAAINFRQTVGVVPAVCATTQHINVLAGTQVFYCYSIENSGTVTLTHHTITDNGGLVFDGPIEIVPGDSGFQLSAGVIINSSTVNTATWLATDAGVTNAISMTSAAEVRVVAPALTITHTVGANANECATTSIFSAPYGSTVYFCLSLHNTGDITLTNHAINASALGLTGNFSLEIAPAATAIITNQTLSTLGLQPLFIQENVTTDIASKVSVTSSSSEGFPTTAQSQANVTVLPQSVIVEAKQTVGTDPKGCALTNNIGISSQTNVYYCLTLKNSGQATLREHRIVDPLLALDGTIVHTLQTGESLVITNSVLAGFGLAERFGPINLTTNRLSTLTVTSKDDKNISATAVVTANVRILATATPGPPTYTPTVTPTPSSTATWTPSPTPRDTETPFPTVTKTATFTPTPVTPTLTPIPPSPLPTPTFTPTDVIITGVESPTPIGGPPTPTETATATPNEATVVAAAQTEEAAATATSIALSPLATPISTSPLATPTSTFTPLPTETPSPTPTITPTPTATRERPLATSTVQIIAVAPNATQRPVATAAPPPAPDYLLFFANFVDSIIATAGRIWFVCGSVLFFVVAGLVVGLYFRQQEQNRFNLVRSDEGTGTTETAPDNDASDASVVQQGEMSSSALASHLSSSAIVDEATGNSADDDKDNDDYWPTSLP